MTELFSPPLNVPERCCRCGNERPVAAETFNGLPLCAECIAEMNGEKRGDGK